MSNPKPLSTAEMAVIRSMLAAGAGLDPIAARLHRAQKTIRAWAAEQGLRRVGAVHGAWSPERSEEAARLWKVGQSASDIARALGPDVTRNAVISKIARLGLIGTRPEAAIHASRKAAYRLANPPKANTRAPRPNRVRTPRKVPRPRINNLAAVNVQRRAERAPREAYVAPAPVLIDATLAKPWIERAFGECAYPIMGEGADTFSCCHPTHGHTYCPAHRAVMFVAPTSPPREQRRAA